MAGAPLRGLRVAANLEFHYAALDRDTGDVVFVNPGRGGATTVAARRHAAAVATRRRTGPLLEREPPHAHPLVRWRRLPRNDRRLVQAARLRFPRADGSQSARRRREVGAGGFDRVAAADPRQILEPLRRAMGRNPRQGRQKAGPAQAARRVPQPARRARQVPAHSRGRDHHVVRQAADSHERHQPSRRRQADSRQGAYSRPSR